MTPFGVWIGTGPICAGCRMNPAFRGAHIQKTLHVVSYSGGLGPAHPTSTGKERACIGG
jgi:hypothetical protein